MPKCKLNSTRKIVFNEEEEKKLFIDQCKKLVPDGSKKLKKAEFESAVYDLLVDILRAFESRNEKTCGETIVTCISPTSWSLKWQLSAKIEFDFKSKTIFAQSDIDDEFEKAYRFYPHLNCFIEIK